MQLTEYRKPPMPRKIVPKAVYAAIILTINSRERWCHVDSLRQRIGTICDVTLVYSLLCVYDMYTGHVLRRAERMGPLSSTPSTVDVSPSHVHQELATGSQPSTSRHPTQVSHVLWNLYCVWNSHRQVSIGWNLRRFKEIINHIHKCTTLLDNPSLIQDKIIIKYEIN
jgi:hypothetical protein